MSEWYMMIPLMVFTKIKQNFSEELKEKYNMTNKNFSTVGSSDTPAVFPFVYVETLAPVEEGRDFSGTSINGALYTFQIDVFDNESQTNARNVMSEMSRIMKTMGFEAIAMPSFESTKDSHRMTARFRRLIGASETL